MLANLLRTFAVRSVRLFLNMAVVEFAEPVLSLGSPDSGANVFFVLKGKR